jgi:hypothetical protein
MSTCPSCNGVIGRDCFNPEECMAITQDQAGRYRDESARINDLEQWQQAAREAIGVLDLGGWEWTMLPNGARGWSFNGYLRDEELKQLLRFGDGIFPEELT